MTKVSDLIKTLKKNYKPTDHLVVAYWDQDWFKDSHDMPADMSVKEFGEFATVLEEFDPCSIDDYAINEALKEFDDDEPDTYGVETSDIIAYGVPKHRRKKR